jgi:hypothetical protein
MQLLQSKKVLQVRNLQHFVFFFGQETYSVKGL